MAAAIGSAGSAPLRLALPTMLIPAWPPLYPPELDCCNTEELLMKKTRPPLSPPERDYWVVDDPPMTPARLPMSPPKRNFCDIEEPPLNKLDL
jgi:hypothetical protein